MGAAAAKISGRLELEGVYELIGRVYRQAVRDARRGDAEAVEFLDITAPEWRERIRPRPRGTYANAKHTHSACINAGDR